ncbi:hypothetical protein STEG23_019306, partial [Scotinomys teguina]
MSAKSKGNPSSSSAAEGPPAASKTKVKEQIKIIVEDLELVLGDLKDVAKELKESFGMDILMRVNSSNLAVPQVKVIGTDKLSSTVISIRPSPPPTVTSTMLKAFAVFFHSHQEPTSGVNSISETLDESAQRKQGKGSCWVDAIFTLEESRLALTEHLEHMPLLPAVVLPHLLEFRSTCFSMLTQVEGMHQSKLCPSQLLLHKSCIYLLALNFFDFD